MKLCVIGAGIIAESHMKAIGQTGGAQAVAVADIVLDKAGQLAARFECRAYTDYKMMLETERPDAAIVTLPHKLHTEAAVFCAERGIHVLMEKPMAVSTAGCDAMIDAARRGGVKLMVGHVGHYIHENRRAREIVRSGELGELVMIADTRNTDYFVPGRPGWFLRKELAGGGIFMNLGSHSIDKILFLTGSGIRRITGTVNGKTGLDVEGAAQAFLELSNGVSAVVNCNGYKTPYVNETMLYFTEGTVRLQSGSGLWVSRGGEYEPVSCPNRDQDPIQLQLEDFIACIERNEEPPVTEEQGRQVIAAIEAVYRSSEVSSNERDQHT